MHRRNKKPLQQLTGRKNKVDEQKITVSLTDTKLTKLPLVVMGNPVVKDYVASRLFRAQVVVELAEKGLDTTGLDWDNVVLEPKVRVDGTRCDAWAESAISRSVEAQVRIPLKVAATPAPPPQIGCTLEETISMLEASSRVHGARIGTLQENTRELKEAATILTKQAESLQAQLNRQDQTLAKVGETLAKVGETLAKNGETLAKNGETLANHAETLANHAEAIAKQEAEIASLASHLPRAQDETLRRMLESCGVDLLETLAPRNDDDDNLARRTQGLPGSNEDPFDSWLSDEYGMVSSRIDGPPSLAEARDAMTRPGISHHYDQVFRHLYGEDPPARTDQ